MLWCCVGTSKTSGFLWERHEDFKSAVQRSQDKCKCIDPGHASRLPRYYAFYSYEANKYAGLPPDFFAIAPDTTSLCSRRDTDCMDSISQFALGAALAVSVMGRRTAVWKAALWGGLAGTLPDLDALIDFGDGVLNMVLHRSHSHGLFWLTVFAPLLALAASRIHGEAALFKRWCLALWLALFTHPILDTFTIYGTQLLQPFSSHPFGIGSLFIVDPLYTVPLLLGVGVALVRKAHAGVGFNHAMLAFSCAYIAWSVGVQMHVTGVVQQQLQQRGLGGSQVLVTPAPLNTLLWRVVVMKPGGYDEGFYSIFDGGRPIRFDEFASDSALDAQLKGIESVERMRAFSKGFYKIEQRGNAAVLSDLRMGQEPGYVFNFTVAQQDSASSAWVAKIPTEQSSNRSANAQAFKWLWQRMWGADVSPPR
jgi:inner membrane protein